MPTLAPIPAVTYAPALASISEGDSGGLSKLIAPPYDVLTQSDKDRLLAIDGRNIVRIDLPHLPAKTVGPDSVYAEAGETYRRWLRDGVLVRNARPAMFAYQQTYVVNARRFARRGLIANVALQPFGPGPTGTGGVFPHEQTFSGPKEDRLKLMLATEAQLSPIFGLHSDEQNKVHALLSEVIARSGPAFQGKTANDSVLHQLWTVEHDRDIAGFKAALDSQNIFIADGHHRYTTALNYRKRLIETRGPLPADHPANYCLFVLIAMQDPGMIVLPTHRVLGGLAGISLSAFAKAGANLLSIAPFPGTGTVADLAKLQAALPSAGPHAIGLYSPADAAPLAIATTASLDPLAGRFVDKSFAWRQLDVAIVQHLIVEQICQPNFCRPTSDPAASGTGASSIQWKFPHTLDEFHADTHNSGDGSGGQLGLLLQPTPLESVRLVSQANELMPQKSTFFYPKLATGFIINPLS